MRTLRDAIRFATSDSSEDTAVLEGQPSSIKQVEVLSFSVT